MTENKQTTFKEIFRSVLSQFIKNGHSSVKVGDLYELSEADDDEKINCRADIFGNMLFTVKKPFFFAGTCSPSSFDTDVFEVNFVDLENNRQLIRGEVKNFCRLIVLSMYGNEVAMGRLKPDGFNPFLAVECMEALADVLTDKTDLGVLTRDALENVFDDAVEAFNIIGLKESVELQLPTKLTKKKKSKV